MTANVQRRPGNETEATRNSLAAGTHDTPTRYLPTPDTRDRCDQTTVHTQADVPCREVDIDGQEVTR